MKRYTRFLLLWLVNTVLLLGANMVLPEQYTLGNNLFTPLQAAVFTGFVWNLVLWNIEPFFKDIEYSPKSPLTAMLSYLVVNFATLWLLARFAFATGFGVSSYVFVFGLAFVANFLQYQVWLFTEKKKKK